MPVRSSASATIVDQVVGGELAGGHVDAHDERLVARRAASSCASRHASRSTQVPIGTIRPVSSASAMKRSGPTRPRRDAPSARAPRRRRCAGLDRHLGLEETRNSSRSIARRSALSVCRRVSARWRVTSSNSISAPPPASLARYIAASASRIRLPMSWSGRRQRDAEAGRTTPRRRARWNGVLNARRMRSPTAIASCSSRMSSHRIANSSPPNARRSRAGAARGAGVGDRDDQLVAGRVAEAVVDDLEAVEVEEQHGDVAAAAALEAVERLGTGC